MIDNVKSPTKLTRLDDHRRGADPAEPAPTAPPAAAPIATPQDSDVRLVIERSKESGVYVYTLIDRASGRVLTSIPRHEVEAMGGAANYKSGAVVSTKA